MRNQLKTVFGQTAIYSLGNISTKLVGFVLLPLYTGYLTTAEYGILALLEVVNQILIAIFTLNLPTAMLRWCAETEEETEEKSIIFTVYISLLLIAVALFVAGYFAAGSISELLFGNAEYSDYIKVMFLASALNVANRHPLNLLRHRQKAGMYAAINVLKLSIILLLNIYFVAYERMGVMGVVVSLAIGEAFLSLATVVFIFRNFIFRLKIKILKEMLNYGVPLVFAALSSIALTFSDRFILQHYFGESEVGVYSLGYKIAAVINMFLIQSFSLGYLPFTFRQLKEPDSEKLFSKVMTYYTAALFYSALILSLFGKEILLLFSKNAEYLPAYTVIPFIALAFVFRGMQYNLSLSFHFSKRTGINAVIIVGAAILNIVLNYLIVPVYGFLGSGIAMAVSFLAMLIVTVKPAQANYRIPYETKRLAGIIGIALSAFVFYFIIDASYMPVYTGILLKAGLLFMSFAGLFLFGIISKGEIRFLKEKLGLKGSE